MVPIGIVYLVGAGPGDPELITTRGLKVLKRADVIVYDRLINQKLLLDAPIACELIDVGKSPGGPSASQDWINKILVSRAREGKTVIRLKGGDPFVFGRGGEEMMFCQNSGITCKVIPGVSSALAGVASLQIPVTHRQISHNVVIISGHSEDLDYRNLVRLDTVVMLMGRDRLAVILKGFVQAGKNPETPAAAVQWATTVNERFLVANLCTLADGVEKKGLGAPMVVVIGDVVGLCGAVDRKSFHKKN